MNKVSDACRINTDLLQQMQICLVNAYRLLSQAGLGGRLPTTSGPAARHVGASVDVAHADDAAAQGMQRPTGPVQPIQFDGHQQLPHLLQCNLIVGGHILVAVDGDHMAVLLPDCTLLLLCHILVVLLGVETTVLDYKGESKVHEAAMAAMIPADIAVHQLLLT